MNYQQFKQELENKNSALSQSLETVRQAVEKCSEKEKRQMKGWTDYLDQLSTMSEGEYNVVRSYLFKGIGDSVAEYHAPGELFAEKKTQEAMEQVFKALELDKLRLHVPRFTEAGDENAEKAMKEDLLDYSAQLLAFRKLGEDASPAELFRSIGQISAWKKDRSLRVMTEDRQTTLDFLSKGNTAGFVRRITTEKDKIKSQTRTFKEYSDDFAAEYRKTQNYALLEKRMAALRALTEDALRKETDPVKRSRMQEQTMIYAPLIEAKMEEMEHEEMRRTLRAEASEDYQRKLAESISMETDEMLLRVREVYGTKPVFHPEFAASDLGYDEKNFAEQLPNLDTSGFILGGKAVSNEEFASLAALAIYDPEIGGSHGNKPSELFKLSAPDENVSLYFHSHRVVNMSNSRVYKPDGTKMLGPDHRAGLFLGAEIKPAKEKVLDALEAYQRGDKEPLAQIIAYGVRCGTDLSLHEVKDRGSDPRLTGDPKSPIHLQIVSGHCVQETLLDGAVALLERDPELAAQAKKAGLTDAHLEKVRGFQRGHQIIKAGEAAMERILDAARGGEKLSDLEKEECSIALQRRNTLVQSLYDRTKELNPRVMKVMEAFAKRKEKIEAKYGPQRMKTDPEALEEMQKADAFRGRQILELTGTPPVYQRLGKGGVMELDFMAMEQRLGKEKAGKMDPAEKLNALERERERLKKLSDRELASELGIIAPQAAKTTAQDVYNELTKEYKAGKMEYTHYESLLKTMRELTGGNKQAKIDRKTVQDAVDYKLEKSLGPVEKSIQRRLNNRLGGSLGHRLEGMYGLYGRTPKADPPSMRKGAYTAEQFALLKPITEKKEGPKLRLQPSRLIGNNEFAVLAMGATQAFPEIGGAYLVKDKKTGEYRNVIKNPTQEDAASTHTVYITDAIQKEDGGRDGLGYYFQPVVEPGRQKAAEALEKFNAGKGSAEELGMIIGKSLHSLVNMTYLTIETSTEIGGDNALDGMLAGSLAELADQNDKVKDEVLKYTNEAEIETAKGLKVVYDITRAAWEAKECLKESVEKNQPLSEAERRACAELMLMERALTIGARNHANNVRDEAREEKIAEEFNQKLDQAKSPEEKAYINSRLNIEMNRSIGVPEYVRMLGKKGFDYARVILERAMPGCDAFMAKGSAEILKAFEARINSPDDPFRKPEFQKKAYQEDRELAKAVKTYQQKTAANAGAAKAL